MNEQFLESAEFYQKRYHNFASCLIVPSLIFPCWLKKKLRFLVVLL